MLRAMLYFGVQYCTLYAVLTGKCALLNSRLVKYLISMIFSEILRIEDAIVSFLSGHVVERLTANFGPRGERVSSVIFPCLQ